LFTNFLILNGPILGKLTELEKVLLSKFDIDLRKELDNFDFLRQMFQVRHVFEHNMGVVDSDFIKKIPQMSYLLDRKYPLTMIEVKNFLKAMRQTGVVIEDEIKKHYT
jgi:hypothetical protein